MAGQFSIYFIKAEVSEITEKNSGVASPNVECVKLKKKHF